MATTVKNPVIRRGLAYRDCPFCKEKYTALGLSRHTDLCAKRPGGPVKKRTRPVVAEEVVTITGAKAIAKKLKSLSMGPSHFGMRAIWDALDDTKMYPSMSLTLELRTAPGFVGVRVYDNRTNENIK